MPPLPHSVTENQPLVVTENGNDSPAQRDVYFIYSGICVAAVAFQTLYLFQAHFADWKLPYLQKLYLRISCLPLVFSLLAFAALHFPHAYGGLDAARHVYEGYALYAFASLMILHSGGDRAVEGVLTEVREDPSLRLVYGNPFRFPCCELYHFEDSASTLRLHKIGDESAVDCRKLSWLNRCCCLDCHFVCLY